MDNNFEIMIVAAFITSMALNAFQFHRAARMNKLLRKTGNVLVKAVATVRAKNEIQIPREDLVKAVMPDVLALDEVEGVSNLAKRNRIIAEYISRNPSSSFKAIRDAIDEACRRRKKV